MASAADDQQRPPGLESSREIGDTIARSSPLAMEEEPWRRQFRFQRQSERRLDEAFEAMDRELYGRQEDRDVQEEGKTYSCKSCSATFTDHHALAAHVGHQHGGKRRRGRPPRAARANGVSCPLCSQPVPATVEVLAKQFEQEGVDEERALKLATLAWGGLRVPE